MYLVVASIFVIKVESDLSNYLICGVISRILTFAVVQIIYAIVAKGPSEKVQEKKETKDTWSF